MPSTIYSCALSGVEGSRVEIEVDIGRGLSRFMVVGLGDKSVQESKERVRAALLNSGFEFPRQRKIVNLAPADLKKCGPAFDLPIAVGLLAASGQLSGAPPTDALFFGELALDGSLRPTEGVLCSTLLAQQQGFRRVYVPSANASEAGLVEGVEVVGVPTLRALIDHLQGTQRLPPWKVRVTRSSGKKTADEVPEDGPLASFPARAWQALALAAAGGHHLLLSGPPGSGKTLLATHLPSLLPPLTREECIELTQLYSAAGRLPPERALITTRPFRSIHHTASPVSLVGGGPWVKPGEISLAHRGVLFLDEIAEFPRSVLETLRQPLESRSIHVSRANGGATFPAHFTLVAAMNPCPCGYFGDRMQRCRCTVSARQQYQNRLSGPLMDRIDLLVEMPRLSYDDLRTEEVIPLSRLRHNIATALTAQCQRFGTPLRLNTDLTPLELPTHCALTPQDETVLRDAVNLGWLSSRGYARTLKVARTLADMEGEPAIQSRHVEQALAYRNLGTAKSDQGPLAKSIKFDII